MVLLSLSSTLHFCLSEMHERAATCLSASSASSRKQRSSWSWFSETSIRTLYGSFVLCAFSKPCQRPGLSFLLPLNSENLLPPRHVRFFSKQKGSEPMSVLAPRLSRRNDMTQLVMSPLYSNRLSGWLMFCLAPLAVNCCGVNCMSCSLAKKSTGGRHICPRALRLSTISTEVVRL